MLPEPMVLRMPSDPNRLPEIEEFAEQAARCCEMSPSRTGTLGMIVTEAANNSIHHGNHGDPNLPVDIRIEFHREFLKIIFKDAGKGFDPSLLPDPTSPENLLRDSGRGFMILRHFCRDVQTETADDGFITTLVFDRADP
ncbi:MAG: ATP-binding protein [bacterium]|nr:ATP-binding protein [bacterium]